MVVIIIAFNFISVLFQPFVSLIPTRDYICFFVIKITRILRYSINLNKIKFYTRKKKITLITRENVLLEDEEIVSLQSIETIIYIEMKK